jgi:Polysaccharide pyruvyl transferase
MIVVLHAYSRANAGDGLLVDLTMDRLARVGVSGADCVVLALDAASFADLPWVVKVGTAGRAVDGELAMAAARGAGLLAGAVDRRLGLGVAADRIARADAFVAVGGGYLRTGTRVNAFGTAVNHLPQLVAAGRARRPSVYLPQSIGPLAGPVGRAVRAGLRRIGEVHVRDDRSLRALDGLPNVWRTPDLAVLDAGERIADLRPKEVADAPILVGRALVDAPDYPARLRALAHRLGDVAWAVQAEGAAAKSDRTFYRQLGVEPAGLVAELVGRPEFGPVVSVRLHGALQALLAGVPAVHLGYERKSWGAYEDLGLGEWVHSARGFDPELVAAQVEALRADPEPFWKSVRGRREALLDGSAALTTSLREALG